MLTAEDPAPEIVHDCVIVSTTTNGSLQEAKNSVTSRLTVPLGHSFDFVECGFFTVIFEKSVDI